MKQNPNEKNLDGTSNAPESSKVFLLHILIINKLIIKIQEKELDNGEFGK